MLFKEIIPVTFQVFTVAHRPDDGGSAQLWNVDLLQHYAAQYNRRLPPSK
jgi:hypothetical protein